MPKKKVSEHTRQDVVVPAHKFSDFVMIHTQFGFCLLKALLNSPAHPAKPYQGFRDTQTVTQNQLQRMRSDHLHGLCLNGGRGRKRR